jgi:hypothetical protein
MAALATLCLSAPAQAIDVDAGDYEPAAPGTNVALLYLQHARNDGLYSNGDRQAGNNRLNTDIGIFRAVHFMEIGGIVADPQILIPFGRVAGKGDTSGLGDASGIGDPILAATFWVQNDPVNKVYTGITPYLYVPIGSYDRNDALNLGENRWKYNLQVAHVRRLSKDFSLDLVGDVMLYGDNTDFGATGQRLEQKPLVQGQVWLRYHLSPTADLRLLLSHTVGGETKIDGTQQNDERRTTKFAVGGSIFVGPKTQLLGMIGRDASVEQGFREESRINVRILQLF